jgi:hypothetical protein
MRSNDSGPDGSFGEEIADANDGSTGSEFDPGVIAATVDFLAALANQRLVSHHFNRVGDRIEYSAGPFRYVWPSELDLMAQMAGLQLAKRWSGWGREPFTSESSKHFSVWEKPRA